MFFFIGGVQPRTVRLEKESYACPSCSHFEIYRKRIDHYISVFFIPLFPIKRGVPFTACENCGALMEGGDAYSGQSAWNRTQRCGSCGRTADAGYSYCPYCGQAL